MSSKISGFSISLCFILSFIAVIMLLALSSAPCFELFSAAPVKIKCEKRFVTANPTDRTKLPSFGRNANFN